MTRADWSLLGLDREPAPGDPDRIRRAARQASDMAAVATSAHGRLGAVVSRTNTRVWAGASGDQFRATAEHGLTPALGLVADTMRGVSSALRRWANDVEDAQRQRDHLLRQATTASYELESASAVMTPLSSVIDQAQRELDDAEPGSAAARAAAGRLRDARAQLSATSASVMAAQRRMEAAAQDVCAVIEDYEAGALRAEAALRRSAEDTPAHTNPPDPGIWDDMANGSLDVLATIGNGVVSVGNAMTEHPDETAALLIGLLTMAGGDAIESSGVALDATGVGAVAGVPLNIIGAGVIGAGATAAGAAGVSIGRHAMTDSSRSPFDTDHVMKSHQGEPGGAGTPESEPEVFTPDDFREAAALPDRNMHTYGGRALQKHSDRVESVFYGLSTGKPSTRHAQAMKVLEEILNDPGLRITRGINVTVARDSSGRAARMHNNGTFMGFLEPGR